MMHKALPSLLSPEHAAWLAATLERNHATYAGWRMGPEEGSKDDESDDDEDDDNSGDGDDSDEDDDKTDWKAKFEAQQKVNRTLERKTRRDARTIADLTGKKPEGGGKSGGKEDDDNGAPDLDKVRADAKAEAVREALNGRVEDKIEAKASAFADPEDAVAVLLRTHDHEDFLDGDKVDVEAITDALKELGEKKPHLLAQGGKRFQGSADGGSRKGAPKRAASLGEAVARRYADD